MNRVALLCSALLLVAAHPRAIDPHYLPVKAVGTYAFEVVQPEGAGVLHYFGTGSLGGSPKIVMAIVNLHGLLRDADVYERVGEKVLAAGHAGDDTLLITPQFLASVDVTGHSLPPETLRWTVHSWLDGKPAEGPAPLTVFSVLDAIVQRLGDRTRFPALREIVVIGHSAGGQVAHRYAVVGRAQEGIAKEGIGVRYVVANPSSYVYFNRQRPTANGGFAPYDAARCPAFDRWKFGFEDPPAYVDQAASWYETRYIAEDVTYLLGQLDVDPQHAELDRTCPAEAEGAYRFARGLAYVRYIKMRHPNGTNQSRAEVAGAAHSALDMFASACGLEVIFKRPRKDCKENERI